MDKTEELKKIVDDLDLGVTTDPADEDFDLDVKGALCQRWVWAYEGIIEKHGAEVPEEDETYLGEVAADWIDQDWSDFLAAPDKAAFWDRVLSDMRKVTKEKRDWEQYGGTDE